MVGIALLNAGARQLQLIAGHSTCDLAIVQSCAGTSREQSLAQ
jgi:hypothetical protein